MTEWLGRPWAWFASLLAISLLGQALAWAASALAGIALLPGPAAVPIIAGSVLAAALGSALINRTALARQAEVTRLADAEATTRDALEHALAERVEQHRRLRHDLRGALSPALLTADRLLDNPDPKIKRAGEMMVRAVERASALMADPAPPPADDAQPPS